MIPPQKNRHDQRHYDIDKVRHLVENTFLYLKCWCDIAIPYVKNTSSFLALFLSNPSLLELISYDDCVQYVFLKVKNAMPLVSAENEYDNAARYDAEYGHFEGDFPFFQKLCRSFERQINILDLGCGTGRLTFALAPYAKTILGIDHSNIMLQRAKEKEQSPHAHPSFQPLDIFSQNNSFSNMSWEQGDLCAFSLKKTFDLITLSGNTFQALLTADDQRKALSCVKNHMQRESIFAFNLRNPRPEDLVSHEDFRPWHTFKDQNGDTIHVHGRQTYDPKTQIMHYDTLRIYPGGMRISRPLSIFALQRTVSWLISCVMWALRLSFIMGILMKTLLPLKAHPFFVCVKFRKIRSHAKLR